MNRTYPFCNNSCIYIHYDDTLVLTGTTTGNSTQLTATRETGATIISK